MLYSLECLTIMSNAHYVTKYYNILVILRNVSANDVWQFRDNGRRSRNRTGAVDRHFDCQLSVLCGAPQAPGVGRTRPLGGNEIGAKEEEVIGKSLFVNYLNCSFLWWSLIVLKSSMKSTRFVGSVEPVFTGLCFDYTTKSETILRDISSLKISKKWFGNKSGT